MSTTEPLVPIEDLAKHFTVSVSTIRTWVRHGMIPKSTYIKAGNTYRFSIPAVVAALSAAESEPEVSPKPPDVPAPTPAPVHNPDEDF